MSMARFNIDSHLSNGRRLDWLALPDKGETAQQVVSKVKQAAVDKFGASVFFKKWTHVVASNGYVTVQMHA
jgi:hypothetical protein